MEITSVVNEWWTLPQVAEFLDVKITKVHRLISEQALLAVRIPSAEQTGDLVRAVPAAFFTTAKGKPRVLESLKGTITLLKDAKYSDEEAIRWLFSPQEGLEKPPIEELADGHKTEVRRRAQALAW